MSLICYSDDLKEPSSEIIERKGFGHPDTIADHLAERLSHEYSIYCIKHFGAVLHHNFDKLSLLGGSAHVEFGKGYLTQPIRVLINGRATRHFGSAEIPLEVLIKKWTHVFFADRLPLISVKKDLRFIFEISTQSSPGKIVTDKGNHGPRSQWFAPVSLRDLPELRYLHSNDTSAGVGYAPFSIFERGILKLEHELNHQFAKHHPWAGSDIKIMGVRNKKYHELTLCVPQIASRVKNISEYVKNKEITVTSVLKILKRNRLKNVKVYLNTRDNEETPELYLTAIGTSLESGDEGVVGRGNRINGLITLQRAMSMEGASGKNPVYHIGKLYNISAQRIAKKIYREMSISTEISLVSQSGRSLVDPWFILVRTGKGVSSAERKKMDTIILNGMKMIPRITSWLLEEPRKLA